MSTTFAVKAEGEMVNIAIRHNGGRIEIYNPLVFLLNKDRRVYAVDNTQQGIVTIKDLLEKLK